MATTRIALYRRVGPSSYRHRILIFSEKARTVRRLRAVVAANVLVVSLQEGKRWLERNAVTFTNAQPNFSGL